MATVRIDRTRTEIDAGMARSLRRVAERLAETARVLPELLALFVQDVDR